MVNAKRHDSALKRDNVTKHTKWYALLAIVLNVILIACAVFSVIHALRNAAQISFAQNIQNVNTLTNASANKVELVLDCYMDEVKSISEHINQSNGGNGMTADELSDFFETYSHSQEKYTWQLAENSTNGESTSAIYAVLLGTDSSGKFRYTVNEYRELVKIFIAANQANVGQVRCTSEFTDAYSLTKSFAFTSTVKVAPVEADGEPQFKTLMLVMKSSYMTELISNNNNIDTLSYFDYSNIIIDLTGTYVISDAHFQGTNFTDYLELYNDNFTDENAKEMRQFLGEKDYSEVMYFLNSKGQECAYTIVPVQDRDWYILSIVPVSSFGNSYNFSNNFLVFAAFFSLLFAVDIIFALSINRRLRLRTKEAQEANESKSVFLSSMSHDIRTPMNAIVGMTIVANRQLDEENIDRAVLRDCMKSIELSGNHLLTLINDVLDISKIESGKIVLHPSDFSIADTVSRGIEMCQTRMNDRSLYFEVHIQKVTHEFVTGDSLRINQIFINLLTNAIKYTRSGGKITVTLSEETIPGNSDAARYVYTVSDTGIGMSPEFMETIFDRFTRAVDTRINEVQGTGLGMAIVKQLVDLMCGTITVESKLDVGSTFTVALKLPIVKKHIDNAVCKDLHILLIDDDDVLLETTKDMLEEAGACADVARGGDEGIKTALAHHQNGNDYNIIFVDWKMDAPNGYEVVKQLREKLGDSVQIVVMTAYNLTEVEKLARSVGANCFINKPLFKSKLISVIEYALTGATEAVKSDIMKFPDLRLLVVEDNDTNWKVLNKIMTYYEINADRVQNGKIAVETVENSEPYDLIFMDIQMPIMNGYEATKAIRALADRAKAEVPIYAMTADTFANDIEKCHSVGMNGHLPKPIDIQSVVAVLQKINASKNS